MTERHEKLMSEWGQNGGDDAPETTMRFMTLDRLDRIASALEGIETAMQGMKGSLAWIDQNFDSCIGRGNAGNFIRGWTERRKA